MKNFDSDSDDGSGYDEAIERVLAGLGEVEAPAGMERRILRALEEPGAMRAGAGWRGRLRTWRVVPGERIALRHVVGGVALAGVLVVALAVVAAGVPAIHRLGRGSSRMGIGVASVAPAVEVAAKPVRRSSDGVSVPSMRAAKVRGARLVRAADADGADFEETVAWSEMHAASFPAPPMPLTEQERLLLKIAHKGDPVELAMLDPKMRAARDEEDKAEVQRFFVQPKVQMDPEQGDRERTATADSVAGGQQRQQQISSGDDNQKSNDNAKDKGSKTAVPEQSRAEPGIPVLITPEQAGPQ